MSPATLEVETMDPKLLTEIQRQEAALADLPEEYEFPLFDGRHYRVAEKKRLQEHRSRRPRDHRQCH